jgi:hypothetical protein
MTRLLRLRLARPIVWLAEALTALARAIRPKEDKGQRVHWF